MKASLDKGRVTLIAMMSARFVGRRARALRPCVVRQTGSLLLMAISISWLLAASVNAFGSPHTLGYMVAYEPDARLGVESSDQERRVQEAYVAYYGRPADPSGLEYWSGRLADEGGALEGIIQSFGVSAEYDERYGHLSNDELIDRIFDQMFDRDPDPAGLGFYLDQLNTGSMTLQTITLNVLDGAQNEDATIIDHKIEVAEVFTQRLAETGLPYTAEEIPEVVAMLADVDATRSSVERAEETVYALLPMEEIGNCASLAGYYAGTSRTNYCDGEFYVESWVAEIDSDCYLYIADEDGRYILEGQVEGNTVTAEGNDSWCGRVMYTV